jgi:hypothetical protein
MWLNNVDFFMSVGVPDDLCGGTTTSPAQTGSNILEYGRLSELSLNLEYLNNVVPLVAKLMKGDAGLVASSGAE